MAVNLEPLDDPFVAGFEVTLHYLDADGGLIDEVIWSEVAPSSSSTGEYYRYMQSEQVPAGAVTLVSWMRTSDGGPIAPASGPGCATEVDVAVDDQARITVLFAPDLQGDCAAVAAANREADELLAMSRGLPAPGFVGLDQPEAVAAAAARGWSTRVVARDGEPYSVTQDYITLRVNLVIEQGVVMAAARG